MRLGYIGLPIIVFAILTATQYGHVSEQQIHWAFRPLKRIAIPAVRDADWCRTPIDRFILAELERKRLKPSAPADRRTLIRRAYFDLIGLPPTPEEIESFLNDKSANAFEKVVDSLLASQRYGERWGRHWLDVVHYGDTHGYDKDKRRDHAWPYRDYVIRSFNSDKPYSQFVSEQIAGDVLHPDDPEGVIATGFIAAGPWDFVGHVELREGTVEKAKTRLLDRDDMVANTMSTFNSVTVHCARCHDHKFDPIPQKEYYQLQAVFAGVDRGDRAYGDPSVMQQRAPLQKKRDELVRNRAGLLKQISEIASPEIVRIDHTLQELRAALELTATEIAEIEEQMKDLPQPDYVYSVVTHEPRPIHLLTRGEVERPGESVVAGSLSCVPGMQSELPMDRPDDEGNRRAALSKWITSPSNVLTWRSIANRVWHYHFGRGLVDTPNDFGRNGSLPTHPELLDWLAIHFRDSGQSIKKLHKLIMLSAVYQQSSHDDPAFARIDADNRYLWRMNRRRLDAESIRDSVLAVSGTLDVRMGGPGFDLFRFKDDHSPVYDHSDMAKVRDPSTWRRTVYRFTVRSVPNPFLECLDGADPNINTPVRNTTITALQALVLLNNPFMIQRAEFFADRVRSAGDVTRQIKAAYLLAFGRPPEREELASVSDFANAHGTANACRLLLNANEFVFID